MIEIESEQVKELTRIAITSSDIREDKINELKKRIASGTYEVDVSKIVDGILKETIRECLSQEKN